LFLNCVSVVHFTPCFWARFVVLRLHFQVAIFSSSVPVFFPSIRSWIPDHVRQCLGFCCCFIRRLRPLVSEVLVLVFLCSDQIFSSAECVPGRAGGCPVSAGQDLDQAARFFSHQNFLLLPPLFVWHRASLGLESEPVPIPILLSQQEVSLTYSVSRFLIL
jgi:hypothetical protein